MRSPLGLPLVCGMVLCAWVSAVGCGSPVDEEWEGEWSDCSNSSTAQTLWLTLDGPVTTQPQGKVRYGTGNGIWIETELKDATYLGPKLKFTSEFKFTLLGLTAVSTVDFDLTRSPGHLNGETTSSSSGSTVTCKVALKPKK